MTLAAYWPAFGNDFVLWDDNIDLYENIHIRSMGTDFFLWALSTQGKHLWEPVTWISFALDHALWGLRPAGYHLTSVLLHAVNTVLAFFLVTKLLETAGASGRPSPSSGSGQGMLIAAGATAALFGLHPLQVESTAWVSARPALLQALFSLLSIMAYVDYAVSATDAARRGSKPPVLRKQYLASFVCFALACGSKASAVALPALFLALDWRPLNRFRGWKKSFPLFTEKLPFFAGGMVLSIVTYSAQKAMGTMDTLMESSAATRALAAVKAIALYLAKIAAPFGLSPFYPFPESASPASFENLPALLLLAGIAAGSLLLIRKRPAVPAALLFFLIALLPSLGLVKVREVYMADRYAYLASMGPFFLAGLLAAGIAGRVDRLRSRTANGALAALAVCLLLILSLLTRKQIDVWKNSVTLWSTVIEKEPRRVPVAYLNRGLAYESMGLPEQAVGDFSEAISLGFSSRYTYLAYNNRGTTLAGMGRIEEGMQDLNRAIRMDPDRFLAYTNRGLVLGTIGLYDRAIEDFGRAIALNPASVDSYVGRAVAYEKTNRPDLALPDLDKAIALDPYNADAYLNRGVSFERTGRRERALSDYEKAVSLEPTDHLAYGNRGRLLSALGETGRALEDLSTAITLKPDFGPAYAERAVLYRRSGREELAFKDLERACGLGLASACDSLPGAASSRNER